MSSKALNADDIKLKSTATVDGIQDDQFFRIQDEKLQIRSSLGMYISKDGTDGALHLMKEIFNNALDECNNANVYWKGKKKEIVVEFYESERKIIITDNGRGIPSDILVDAVMHKHTSTKTIGVSEIRNKKQAGLNGRHENAVIKLQRIAGTNLIGLNY